MELVLGDALQTCKQSCDYDHQKGHVSGVSVGMEGGSWEYVTWKVLYQ